MPTTVREQLDRLPRRNLKFDETRGESADRALQKLNPAAGEVLDLARRGAQLEAKQIAETTGLSQSLVLRALASKGDIGFHRLWELSDDFWTELIVLVVRKRPAVATLRCTIEVDRKVG